MGRDCAFVRYSTAIDPSGVSVVDRRSTSRATNSPSSSSL